MKTGQNFNHPKKGASIKVSPIRNIEDILAIKTLLKNQPRNLCLFTMGINTAYRANELLSLTVGQVSKLKTGDRLEIKQNKNQKYRAITLNNMTVNVIQQWLKSHPFPNTPNAPLFISQRANHSLSVVAVNHLVKRWCARIGLTENYGSHTLRKTWGYHQRISNNASVAILMKAFGHQSEAQTLEYLCIQADEIQELYMGMEL